MKLDSELLGEYAQAGCEDAFAELVQRHVNLVYSAALRQVNGDIHLAQDVAQSVFADLARKAAALAQRPALTGWLYTSTHFTAAKAVRAECRRRTHEQEAYAMHELHPAPAPAPEWEQLVPVLDQVMHELQEADREMILLRYFENRRLAEIGGRFGLSEEAARKRVDRALEKLRAFLGKRGITTTASLASVISANAVQMAPIGLVTTLSTSALAGTALTAATATTLTKTIAMSTLHKALITAAFIGVAGTSLYQTYQATRLRDRLHSLQQQQASLTQQIEQASTDKASLSNQLARADRTASVSTDEQLELLRLRGEVSRLRRQQRELEQTRAAAPSTGPQNAAGLAEAVTQPPPATPFQLQLVAAEPNENTEPITNSVNGEALHLNKAPLMDYTAIRTASVSKSPYTGGPEIDIELSLEGKERFAAITREHLDQRLAIVMNGQLYSAPIIRSEIPGGRILIKGNFSEEEAQQLAATINEAIRH